jgi:RNA polymerase sigma-70 factor (ECF subfamily)
MRENSSDRDPKAKSSTQPEEQSRRSRVGGGTMNVSTQTDLDPVVLSAYQRAVGEYAEPLAGFATKMLGREGDWAEDVAQDALLALYRHLHQVPESAWRPWLYRVTRNLCLDRLRRRKHKPRNFRDFADEEDRDPIPPSEASWQPEHRVRDNEIERDLQVAIEELPPKFREVFLLCEGEGLSYEQVATILDIPLKTVSTRLYRARQRLLKAMQEHLS